MISDQFAWYENDGSTPPVWTLRVIDSGTTNADGAYEIEAVDFDGDGDTDVVTAAKISDQFAWYENDGSTPPVWTLHVIDSGTTNADGAQDIEAVDLDGDGDTDVVTAAPQLRSVRLVRDGAPRRPPVAPRLHHAQAWSPRRSSPSPTSPALPAAGAP